MAYEWGVEDEPGVSGGGGGLGSPGYEGATECE